VDEPKWESGWLEWTVFIVIVVVVVIAGLIILLPQVHNIYQTGGPDNLWLHIVGL
jgi:uncharacterized protein with PQ loop repeat